MFRTRVARVVVIPAVIAAASLGSLAFASASGASVKPAVVTVKCTSLSGTAGGTGTISGCSDSSATGGSGTFPATPGSGSQKVSWASGGTTTATFNYNQASTSTCPSGDSEYIITGSVTKNKGAAKSIGTGGKLKGDVCLSSTLQLSLAPGTKFKL